MPRRTGEDPAQSRQAACPGHTARKGGEGPGKAGGRAAAAASSSSRPPPAPSRQRDPTRRGGPPRPPVRKSRRSRPAPRRTHAQKAHGTESSAPPGVNPRSGVLAPPGVLFINTPRGHRQGVTLKVVGLEVRGQRGRRRGDPSLRLCGLLAARLGRSGDPTAVRGCRGRHVVRTWSGPGAAASPPPWRRRPRRPLAVARCSALHVAPAHNASRRAFRSAREPGVDPLRPRDGCGSAAPRVPRGRGGTSRRGRTCGAGGGSGPCPVQVGPAAGRVRRPGCEARWGHPRGPEWVQAGCRLPSLSLSSRRADTAGFLSVRCKMLSKISERRVN